jgi:hypothetical protein
MRKCELCQKEFKPKKSWQRYCCNEHRLQAWWLHRYVEDQAKREQQTEQQETRGAA